MNSVLFVDDEPRVLAGLQRQFHANRNVWTLRFANSGAEALAMLAESSADVLVTDMKMPGMDGAQLLEQVIKVHPDTIRIVLSGHSEDESVLRLVIPAHQVLAKPCDPEHLRATITRALSLRQLLGNADLKHLVSQIKKLPSLPTLYAELLRELRSPSASTVGVGNIIARDLAMSAKILQLVNSAFFGLGHHISHPSEAVTYLGMETMKSLVLVTQVFEEFKTIGAGSAGFSLEPLWQHCWTTGVYARRIAQAEGLDKESIDQCFVAGLLHDLGKLVLSAGHSQSFELALELSARREIPLWVAEKKICGACHAEVGAYLLGLWNFSRPIVEAIAYHHRPEEAVHRELGVASVVLGANLLAHSPSLPTDPDQAEEPPSLETAHAETLDLRLKSWSRLCHRPDDPEN